MAKIFYAEVDFRATRIEKFKFLENAKNVFGLSFQEIVPDKNNNWLNEGMQDDWELNVSLGSKDSKKTSSTNDNVIFNNYSLGANTNRDNWAYNFDENALSQNMFNTIEFYNEEVWKYSRNKSIPIDNFVVNDDTKISWSSRLKECLERGLSCDFTDGNIRKSLYRPYTGSFLYFDPIFTHRRGQLPKIFPTIESEKENIMVCLSGIGSSKPFQSLVVNCIPCLDMLEKTQCFPFYTYNEDGTGRRENITDWALAEYRQHYTDENITKWDIFYYIYGVLHKPEYRTKYAANLRRELPRIPYYEDFWKYSTAGKKLAELHVNYEDVEEYPLTKIEAPGKQLDYRVEKMHLTKDKQTIVYNDFLSLTGIPCVAFEYKLGNRSALDWIIDQYQIKTDKRSGITNDPNRADEPDYILKLIGKIITVSLETVKVVRGL